MERLPGGGKPWFERRKKVRPFGATRWQLVPCAAEGWLVIAGYIAVTLLAVLILFPEPTPVRLVLWGTVEVVATVLLIVIAFRMSPPVWRDK
jgi:hypothetical protein